MSLWAISAIDGKVISIVSNHGNNDGHVPPSLFRHMIPWEANVNVICDLKKDYKEPPKCIKIVKLQYRQNYDGGKNLGLTTLLSKVN